MGLAPDIARVQCQKPGALPDFFIIGAPKCGTTALFTYLKDHPATFLALDRSGKKLEPQFFCSDFPGIAQVHSAGEYQALFDAAPHDRLRGETSAWYLFSKTAVPRLMDAVPDARLIAMLRNPVEMAPSLHNQLLLSLREDVEDFEEAWALQNARRRGEALPRHCREPSHLQYGEVCSFAPQLERLFEQVPRRQVKVILLEDFVARPAATYRAALDFLGLADDGRTNFEKVNERTAYRNQTVVNLLNSLPRGLDPLIYCLKRVANRAGIRPNRLLRQANAERRPGRPISASFKRHLALYFADDICATERILGRSLDLWRERSHAA